MDWASINFDWNHARAFLVTAEKGSFSAASRALDTTQPTLSRQVSAFEDELGIVLFERVGKGILLTSAGEALLGHVRQMAQAAGAFALSAGGQSQSLVGTVCISASEIDAMFRLPAIITSIQALEPGIQIKIVASNEVSDLRHREADIAIRSFRPTEGELITKKLCDESIWLYGHQGYLAEIARLEPDEFFNCVKIIGFDDKNTLQTMLNDAGWHVSDKNFPILTHSHLVQWQLVKSGAGLALFPEDIASLDNAFQIALPQLGAPMTLPLWLVSHRELRTNPRVRRVFDIISSHFSDAINRTNP